MKDEDHKDNYWLWYTCLRRQVFLFLLFIMILISGVMWR